MAVEDPTDGSEPDDRERDFRRIAGMDPAANWLLGVARDDYLPDRDITPVPFLLELADEAAVAAFNALPPLHEGRSGNGALVLGFERSNDRVCAGVLMPVLASFAWFERLLRDEPPFEGFRNARKRILLSSPPNARNGGKRFPDFPEQFDLPLAVGPPPTPWPPGTVVMAVIDDGVAFAHERFRTASGDTRILTHWDMHRLLKSEPSDRVEFDYGEIKGMLDSASSPGRPLDEGRVYAQAGQLDFADPRQKPLAWRLSHGTHVLDLAAGADPGEKVADRPMIAVQLPSPVVARTSGDLLDFYVCLGVHYARHRARTLAPGAPLVVNISFGYLADAHDGKGPLDRFFDQVSVPDAALVAAGEEEPVTRIVLPAGNSQLSRCHATIDFAAGAVELDWIVQPDDRTHSVIEVWLPPTDGADPGNRVAIELTPPGGQRHRIEETLGARTWLCHGDRRMGLMELVARDDGRRMFRIAIMPTARPQPHTGAIAPSGAWRLRFAPGPGADASSGPAEAWVQRDDSLYGHPQRGRQSYFDHPAYVRFDARGAALADDPAGGAPCPVTRRSLLNALASGAEVLVSGGYRLRDGEVADYSAGGPNTPAEAPDLRKPDVLLPSDRSRVEIGVLGAGSRSGARLALDGTSVAAPQLARRLADLLSTDPSSGRREIVATAIDPDSDPTLKPRGGHGRLP